LGILEPWFILSNRVFEVAQLAAGAVARRQRR
jgi:hypothetical protein